MILGHVRRLAPIVLLLLSAACAAAEPAVLRWDGHDIAWLRGELAGHPPAERARLASERLDAIADAGGPLAVGSRETADGTLIEVDGRGALLLGDVDADRLFGETRQQAAAAAAARLGTALAEQRRSLAGDGVTRRLVVAAIAAGVWLATVWLLLRLRRRLLGRLTPRGDATGIDGRGAMRQMRADLLRTVSAWGVNIGCFAAVLAITSVCSTIGLSSLPATHRWASGVIQSLGAMLLELLATSVAALPSLLMAAAIFLAAASINVALNRFFRTVRAGRLQLGWIDMHTARPTSLLASVVLWAAAVVMAYPYLPGSSSEAFKGISVLLGLMVSLGASSQVGQLASGFILIYLRSIRPGDYVRVGECEGTVREIGLFNLVLHTPFHETVSLPNVVVLGSQVTNYSREAGQAAAQLLVPVTIGYDVAWTRVHAVLLAAASTTDGVRMTPAPIVLQRALSDFYVSYALCVHVTDPAARVRVQSALQAAVLDGFHAAGVQIMSPHYLGDPARPKLPPASG